MDVTAHLLSPVGVILQPMFPVQLPCEWPVYNQHNVYQCVQISHAGNDEIMYILKCYKYI